MLFRSLALPTKFTDNYLDFIAPGILVLTMLTAGMQGGSSLIFDKILGFFNKFLALAGRQDEGGAFDDRRFRTMLRRR